MVDTGFARIGLTTCYDLRFPEMYAALRDRGAEILLVPSAFTYRTGQAHWEVLLRARAIENQCFVIAAAQSGRHNDKRESYGQSMVIDYEHVLKMPHIYRLSIHGVALFRNFQLIILTSKLWSMGALTMERSATAGSTARSSIE